MLEKNKYWHEDPTFELLCDIVVENKLICLTGSGISRTLQLKDGSGNAPDWKELLRRINSEVNNKLSEEDRKNITELLSDGAIGEQLIEASSILYNVDSKLFTKALVSSADLKDNETSETHKALLEISPLGILTYNYDMAQENAIKSKSEWKYLLPSDSFEMIELIKNQLKTPFLLKAHGTVEDSKTMVLTRESYRNLFNNNPSYKAFVQYIFTNYQMLIVGFGLSDPDFDVLLQNVFSVYGSPIQKHVVIKHQKEKNAKDTLYKLRYGLNFLYVENFEDIPQIIRDCKNSNSRILQDLIKDCLSNVLETRKNAHERVNKLSTVGKECLGKELRARIEGNLLQESRIDYDNNTENSELVYTLGVLANENIKNKELLIRVIEESKYSEPVAHALVQVKNVLSSEDLNRVDNWIKLFKYKHYFKKDAENPDPDNRILIYCKYLKALLRAKYKAYTNKKVSLLNIFSCFIK